MREVRRNILVERMRPVLRRGADGALKPAAQTDIADVWADRDRARLRQAMETQARKARRKRRHGRGSSQEIEIRLHLPQLPSRAQLAAFFKPAIHSATRWWQNMRVRMVAAAVLAVMLGIGSVRLIGALHGRTASRGAHTPTTATVLPGQPQTPDFETVLPAGKTIAELGGWGRVSPPDRDPVFAYSDTLGGVHVVVSEQPLPSSFIEDLDSSLRKLAKQFGASKKLTATDGVSLYVGTAANGAQSVVTSKNNVLILLRSTSAVTDQLWSDYVYALERPSN